jgi:membrane-bound ClpP family serine protease
VNGTDDTLEERRASEARAAAFALGRRLGLFASRYFLVLFVLGLVGFFVELFFGRGLIVDFTVLVYLALASGLRDLRNGSRTVALLLCGAYLVAALALMEVTAIRGTEGMTFTVFGKEYDDPAAWTTFVGGGVLLAVFGVPFGVLLHPAAQWAFQLTRRRRKVRLGAPRRDAA